MKLRACYGSCRSVIPFSVDHHGYQSDLDQVDETLGRRRAAVPPKHIPHIRLRPVGVGPPPSAEYKTIPTVQRELLTLFEDIGQSQVVLEESADVDGLD